MAWLNVCGQRSLYGNGVVYCPMVVYNLTLKSHEKFIHGDLNSISTSMALVIKLISRELYVCIQNHNRKYVKKLKLTQIVSSPEPLIPITIILSSVRC